MAQQGRMAIPSEAAFAISDNGCIVLWSPLAQAILGFSEGEVLGHPCWEVLQGNDAFGRPLPCYHCRHFLQGRIPNLPQRHFLIKRNDGQLIRLSHEMVLLPHGPGAKALVFMKTLDPKPDNRAELVIGESKLSPSSSYWRNILKWLATLGVITHDVTAGDLSQVLDSSLERVLSMTGAEAIELFLYHRPSREMFLTAHRGLFRRDFYQILRFQRGEGFPGLVAATGEPIMTRELAQDPRYLRTRVKEKGFQFYICVPLKTNQGLIGCLNIASRQRDVDAPSRLQFLSWVSQPLSSAVELAWLRNQQTIDNYEPSEPRETAENPAAQLEQALRHILRAMMAVGQTQAGRAVLCDTGQGTILRRIDQPSHSLGDCALTRHGHPAFCPALATGNPALLSRRHPLPESACWGLLQEAPTALCLPLSLIGKGFGIVTLVYSEQAELLRRLALLGAMADRAARMLYPLCWQMRTAQIAERPLEHSTRSPYLPDSPKFCPSVPFKPSPYLDIRSLGRFQVYREGKLLTTAQFGRRQAITILKVLITHRGHSVSSDFLTECLWTDADPDLAKRRLWVAVHYLRKALDPSPEKKWSVIIAEGDNYYFNTQIPYRLDVEEFLQGMNQGEEQESGGNREKAMEAYQRAAQLYRGDFLEEERYSDWCAAEREYLREVYLSLLKRIAQLYETKGDYEQAILYYRRALSQDNLREELHRQLMACLWHAGRKDEALCQYEKCHKLLSTALGVEPLEETQALYHQILQQ